MTARTIHLNPVEPALLSIRSALGVDLDLDITFLHQNQSPADPTPLMPQLAFMPRSSRQVFAYDVTVTGPANGLGNVKVPGTALTDRNGYNLELYQRRANVEPSDPPVAVGLLAKGVLRLDGSAYAREGPLSAINVPVVVGPPGQQGPPGIGVQGDPGTPGKRGSRWTTGIGAPSTPPPLDTLEFDMYLDETTGDVWQYNGLDWVRAVP
jgi:hypothetical protein